MAAPKEIIELVERFDLHRESYHSGRYNETQLRREFIDPFFKALGWDVDNTAGHAEAYKDVIHEDAIKVGGATKAPDFCDGKQAGFFDEDDQYRVNVFDWNNEFPDIFKDGGFDAVIGNPPYVRQEMIGDFKGYFQEHYRVYHGSADLYAYFIEKGVSLLKPGGYFSYIVANKWMRTNYGQPLREWLKQQAIEELIDFGDLPVFKNATTYPCIIRIKKGKPAERFTVAVATTLQFESLDAHVQTSQYPVQMSALEDSGWSITGERTQALLKKLKAIGIPLGNYAKGKIYRGVLTGLNEAFVIDRTTRDRLVAEDPKSAELIKPFLAGRDIKRCHPLPLGKFLIFTRRGADIKKYPAIEKHLQQFKEKLMPKPADWKGTDWKGRKPGQYKWYEIQDTIDYFAEFEKPKIIVPSIVQKASYSFDPDGFLSNDKTTIIAVDDLYLLGVLNSKACDFVMHSLASTKQGGYYEYKPMYLSQLPIRTINFSDPTDKARHDRMVELVEQMLTLNKKLAEAKTDQDKTILQRRIDATDSQIDRLVYELYGLTDAEIKIIES